MPNKASCRVSAREEQREAPGEQPPEQRREVAAPNHGASSIADRGPGAFGPALEGRPASPPADPERQAARGGSCPDGAQASASLLELDPDRTVLGCSAEASNTSIQLAGS